MGTSSSGTPPSSAFSTTSPIPPTSTDDQNFALQNSATPANTPVIPPPQMFQHATASQVFEESDFESETDNSEPRFQIRHFPDSGDEVLVIEHASTSSTTSSSTATGTGHPDLAPIEQQVKAALMNRDRGELQRLLNTNSSLLNAQVPDLQSPPLLVAVRLGDKAIVKDLLNTPGIHVDARDSEHKNAVHVACETGNLELTRLLKAHGASLHTFCKESTPLIAACVGNNLKLISYVLRKTPGNLIDFWPNGGYSALVHSVRQGNIDVVRKLITHGANPNRPGSSGKTPLHYAAEYRQVAIAKLLMRHGAIQLKSTFGYPLDLALRSQCLNMLDLLFAIPPASEEWKACALVTAIETNPQDLIEALLARGVSADAKLQNQSTPLMFAVEHGHAEAANLLTEKGADVAYLSPQRQSALSKAIVNDRSPDLILTLLSAMPVKVVLDPNLMKRLIDRAKHRQDYRILNELAGKKLEDKSGNAYELRGLLN